MRAALEKDYPLLDAVTRLRAGSASIGFDDKSFTEDVFIACLGVFGLAAHSVEKRTREVGARKVMGAGDIVRLFLWRFSKPVLLANAIAWPLAWLALRNWLEGFACRVARAKPIHALRYE